MARNFLQRFFYLLSLSLLLIIPVSFAHADKGEEPNSSSVTAQLGETVTADLSIPVLQINETGIVDKKYVQSTISVQNVIENTYNRNGTRYVRCYANNNDWYGSFTGGIRFSYTPGGVASIISHWPARHEVNNNGILRGWSTNGYYGFKRPYTQNEAIQKGFFYHVETHNRTRKIQWRVHNNGSCQAWISRYDS